MKKKQDLSIVVSTYNRADSLRDTLKALKEQKFDPSCRVEIIVIDNNSSEHTRPVAEEAIASSPFPMRYVFEKIQGISAARNRGIAESAGEYIFFTDDDIVPPDTWAQALLNGMRKFQADCAGGAVLPLWYQEPPDWLREPGRQFGLLAMMDRGEEPLVADQNTGHFLVGANMGFKKSALDELGGFRTDLGAVGNELMRGEDMELIKRFIRANKKVMYIPGAPVRHKVQPERLKLSYMRKWQYDAGKSFARSSKHEPGMPRWLVRECLENGLAAVWNYATFQKLKGVNAEERFWNKLGMLRELGRKK